MVRENIILIKKVKGEKNKSLLCNVNKYKVRKDCIFVY